jgi:hypothetical protein
MAARGLLRLCSGDMLILRAKQWAHWDYVQAWPGPEDMSIGEGVERKGVSAIPE